MIKLYGISSSRALRPLWLLEEIGIEYEHYPVDFRTEEVNSEEYLAINPNGRVPALVDGDLTLFESMAINLYLAQKYGGDLFPDNEADAARANMWSYWVMTEVEYSLLSILMNTRILPQEKRQPDKIEHNREALEKPFAVLNQALSDRAYLLGNEFTIADLNVAAVMSWCRPARLRLDQWPDMKDWLDKCMGRPAFKVAMRK